MPAPRAPSVPKPPIRGSPSPKLTGPRTPAGGVKMSISNAAKNLRRKVGNAVKRFRKEGDISVGGAGSRENPSVPKNQNEMDTPEGRTQVEAQNRNDPNSQHSPEGKARSKDSFSNKAKAGALGALGLLATAAILAAIIQGQIDCDNINHTEPDIKDIKSAAWPEYPESWPDWMPKPQSNKNKVWLTYSPAIHLLTTDTIKLKFSNTAGVVTTSLTGDHAVLNNDDDELTLIEIPDTYNPNEVDYSNVIAKFDITTNCEDRMAYQAGQELEAVVSTGSNVFGSAFGSIPWRTILLVCLCIAVAYFFIKSALVLKSTFASSPDAA